MRKKQFFRNNWMAVATLLLFLLAGGWFLATKYSSNNNKHRLGVAMEDEEEGEENDEYDGPDKAAEFEFMRTKNPATGKIPREKMWQAVVATEQLKEVVANSPATTSGIPLSWIERGSNSDVVGPTNGNTRPGNGVTSGRIRAVWVDLADATGKTIWIGGVDGGLWKTSDITAATPAWNLVNDNLSNLAVSGITQDPTNTNIMYFCTGESFFNSDAVNGNGVFKSTDHGVSWALLPTTSNLTKCSKILCDATGNVYVSTIGISVAVGLQRSNDKGATWTGINPFTNTSRVVDFEISSTGTIHAVAGLFSAAGIPAYKYNNNPATATSANWTDPVTPFPYPTGGNQRIEIACAGATVYASLGNSSSKVDKVSKSVDGGANWATTTLTATNITDLNGGGQGWYAQGLGVDPSNPNNMIVGSLNSLKSVDGGGVFSKISEWVGTTGQYVHADIHNVTWYDNGNKLLIGCDGGIFYSDDKGLTFKDKNTGIRIKQFYSVAVHPTAGSNYFLAGAQDNGVHQFNQPGLGFSTEVTGGDGAIVAIDQDQPQFQFGSYIYNQYRRSTNGGATWGSVNFSNADGLFINPFDYDNLNNHMYCGHAAGQYLRWNDPQTGNSSTLVPVPAFSGQSVSSVNVSPNTANRVFFGTTAGRVVKVDGADGAAPVDVNITPAGLTGYVNSVIVATDPGSAPLKDQNLIATVSSYSVNNVWVTTNGGTSWTQCDGNLPDMPVYWAFYYPEDLNRVYIATETGVWSTDALNGASTVWAPETTFPTVKTMMLQYRSSDRTLAAATHGRGLWTTTVPLPTGFDLGTPAAATAACPAPASMSITLPTTSNGGFSNTISFTATGAPAGTTISPIASVAPGSSTTVTLNNTNTLSAGSYTIVVTGSATGAPNVVRNLTFTITAGAGPTITTPPASQALCEGGSVTFTVAASAGTYQWQVSTPAVPAFTNITGQTAASLTINPVTASMNANQYRCVVSTLCGITNSAAAVLTVNTAPTITAQPQSATLCAGSNNTFSVTATGTAVTYQWQISTAAVPAFTNIPGATSSTFTVNGITAAMNGDQYKCVVSGTCSPAATSAAATLNVVTSVAVTTQPVNTTACDASPASFTVAGSGSGVIYQWQVNTGSGFVNIPAGAPYSGINGATLTISAVTNAMNNYQYRALLSNASCTTPGISNIATLSVNSLPNISANPQDATICIGGGNTFSVTASGTGITYQWQVSTAAAPATFVNIPGATSSTFAVTNATAPMNGNQYKVVVTGTCSASTATSTAAILTVITPASITTQPANAEICSGTNSTFTVVAASPQQPVLYQWDVSTDGGTNWTAIPGATASTYTVTSAIVVMTNNRYRVRVSNATCTVPAVSGSATLTVRQLPTVGLTASATSLSPGQSSTLTATPSLPTGGTLSTTWTFNGAPLAVTGNTYIANVEKVGAYQVRIQETWPSSLFCSNLSQVVTIDAPASSKLFVFPSPNDGRFTVSYYNNGGSSTSRSVTVYDSRGSRVEFKKFTVTGPYTLLAIDIRPAQKGVYYVVVGDAAGKQLADGKVIIQ